MAKQIVAQTVETYAKARNLNLQSNQLEAITNLLVSKMKLENESLRIANDMGGTNASILRTYGHEKARLGNQALHASTEKQIMRLIFCANKINSFGGNKD